MNAFANANGNGNRDGNSDFYAFGLCIYAYDRHRYDRSGNDGYG